MFTLAPLEALKPLLYFFSFVYFFFYFFFWGKLINFIPGHCRHPTGRFGVVAPPDLLCIASGLKIRSGTVNHG